MERCIFNTQEQVYTCSPENEVVLEDIDYTAQDKYWCLWCSLKIIHYPVGIPIKEITKTAYKELTSNDKTIYRTVLQTEKNEDNSVFYQLDGVFCSFQCALAHIKDNCCSLYSQSECIIRNMHKKFQDEKLLPNEKLLPASNKRFLKRYGGIKTDEEYRKELTSYTSTWISTNCYKSQTIYKIIV